MLLARNRSCGVPRVITDSYRVSAVLWIPRIRIDACDSYRFVGFLAFIASQNVACLQGCVSHSPPRGPSSGKVVRVELHPGCLSPVWRCAPRRCGEMPKWLELNLATRGPRRNAQHRQRVAWSDGRHPWYRHALPHQGPHQLKFAFWYVCEQKRCRR